MFAKPIKSCPQCQLACKNNNLVLHQISLTTAVYLCEDKNCSYPSGFGWIEVKRSLDELLSEKQQSIGETDLDHWLVEVFENTTNGECVQQTNASDYKDDSFLAEIFSEFDDKSFVSKPATALPDINVTQSTLFYDNISDDAESVKNYTRKYTEDSISEIFKGFKTSNTMASMPDIDTTQIFLPSKSTLQGSTDNVQSNKKFITVDLQSAVTSQAVIPAGLTNKQTKSPHLETLPDNITHKAGNNTQQKVIIELSPSTKVPWRQQTQPLLPQLPHTTVIKVLSKSETRTDKFKDFHFTCHLLKPTKQS